MKIRNLLVLLICVSISHPTLGQIKDSIGVLSSKIETSEQNNDLVDITIKDGSNNPICIMHSAYINLFLDPPQRLAHYKREGGNETFNLHYSARDRVNTYENTNPNYNAEIVLPLKGHY